MKKLPLLMAELSWTHNRRIIRDLNYEDDRAKKIR